MNQEDVLGSLYPPCVFRDKKTFASLALIELLSLSDDLKFIFALTIHSIFIQSSKPDKGILGSYGGSSSGSIGTIWLSVIDKIEKIDLMEMYVHELTHHLLFIDELNHPQFNYREIISPENFALSAILKKKRPLDKVVHSIVVGTELLCARYKYLNNHLPTLVHPSTKQLQLDTIAAIKSVCELRNIDDLITRHMREIVNECAEICRI